MRNLPTTAENAVAFPTEVKKSLNPLVDFYGVELTDNLDGNTARVVGYFFNKGLNRYYKIVLDYADKYSPLLPQMESQLAIDVPST